jgi:hypothetical protein
MMRGPLKWRLSMYSAADDFTEIARRVKEIEAEVEKPKAEPDPAPADTEERQRKSPDVYDDMAVCA